MNFGVNSGMPNILGLIIGFEARPTILFPCSTKLCFFFFVTFNKALLCIEKKATREDDHARILIKTDSCFSVTHDTSVTLQLDIIVAQPAGQWKPNQIARIYCWVLKSMGRCFGMSNTRLMHGSITFLSERKEQTFYSCPEGTWVCEQRRWTLIQPLAVRSTSVVYWLWWYLYIETGGLDQDIWKKKTNKKGNVFLFLRWTRKEMLSGLSTTCALLSTSPLMSFFSFRSH